MNNYIYIHVPFCKAKCKYCDFTSYAGFENRIDDYIDALIIEMSGKRRDISGKPIKTIFIGGGTPSLLTPSQMDRVLSWLYNNAEIEDEAEITIEANPGTLDADKLKGYYNIGINRLSIGLQAYQNSLLKKIGRIHTIDDFTKNYEDARDVGFDNISIDIMSGLPDQTLADWEETLSFVVEKNPEHISAYSLKIEDGTPFGEMQKMGKLSLPIEDIDINMSRLTLKLLRNKGYERYEVSNYAKNGKRSQHNINYWQNGDYIGIGCSAVGYKNRVRGRNISSIDGYIKNVHDVNNLIEDRDFCDDKKNMFETVMLNLRMIEGIKRSEFSEVFNLDPVDWLNDIHVLSGAGFLILDDDFIRLTDKGFEVMNAVLTKILP